jgi:hypothetical protein
MFCILIDLKRETFDVAPVNPCQMSIKSVAAFSQDWFGLISNSPPLHSTPPLTRLLFSCHFGPGYFT